MSDSVAPGDDLDSPTDMLTSIRDSYAVLRFS